MKKMLSISNTVIAAILSLLGCTVEGPDEYGTPLVEYGTPSADFIISGKVTSPAGTPVKNISVVMREGDRTAFLADSTGTDKDGKYRVLARTFPQSTTFQLAFSDIDDEDNGALKDTTLTVDFNNPQFTGGDKHWHRGETSKEVDIQLRPKE
jgi:putative lipoprotein (rSAM/lipoprotein system)